MPGTWGLALAEETPAIKQRSSQDEEKARSSGRIKKRFSMCDHARSSEWTCILFYSSIWSLQSCWWWLTMPIEDLLEKNKSRSRSSGFFKQSKCDWSRRHSLSRQPRVYSCQLPKPTISAPCLQVVRANAHPSGVELPEQVASSRIKSMGRCTSLALVAGPCLQATALAEVCTIKSSLLMTVLHSYHQRKQK